VKRPFAAALGFCIALSLGMAGCGGPEVQPPFKVPANDASSIVPVDASDAGIPTDAKETKPSSCDGSAEIHVRVVAANITSGTKQSYDDGAGARIFKALAPDVVLIQEFNFGDGSDSAIQGFVGATFGGGFSYVRGPSGQIPNGIISRYPIRESGDWIDPKVSNRTFVWARIDVPGTADLWAVSIHLLTSNASERRTEGEALANFLGAANIPSGDLITIGGDFNTNSRDEPLATALGGWVSFAGPYPQDTSGNPNTNATRGKPYDWVTVSPALAAGERPVKLASQTLQHGLVFDTRAFASLAALMPPLAGGESAAPNMQHMAVVREFFTACE
jgi:endonuclease/exonuclease/phosphatase family metal-dependent hydrolase